MTEGGEPCIAEGGELCMTEACGGDDGGRDVAGAGLSPPTHLTLAILDEKL